MQQRKKQKLEHPSPPQQERFYVNDPDDRKALQEKAHFGYGENYITDDPALSAYFDSEEFEAFLNTFNKLNAYIARVARLGAYEGWGVFSGKDYTFTGEKSG